MKTIKEDLCRVISDLEGVCATLNSLTKEVEFTAPHLPVDEYFKFLLASDRIREAIRILEGITDPSKLAVKVK